jgi:putative DNA primase/helicase
MSGIIVSFVSCATDVETQPIALEKVISAIRTGGKRLKGQIEQIRNKFESELALTGDYKAAKELVAPLKKQLPGILYSAKKIARRENEALEEHSGLFCADQDALGDAFDEVWTQLTKSQHVMLAFRSPCGDGIKTVFKVAPIVSRHRDSFRAIRAYVLQLTGKEIDDKCKDEARMNFLSFDPQIYVNLDAIVIEPLPPLPKREYTSNITDLGLRQRCAVELLGAIDWDSDAHGFLPCPGQHLHTSGNNKRDCEIHLNGAPTLHCFHNHCSGFLAGLNRELRSRIAKVERENAPKIKVPHEQPEENDDAEIKRLAALPTLEYERQRKEAAKKLGCRDSVLDRLINAERLLSNPRTDDLQGTAVHLPEIELWPEPVNGAEVLDAISTRFSHYVVMPKRAGDMLALWCAHTHVYKVFQITPRANIISPTPECGKTTLRDCAALFCAHSMPTENMTTAVMFRLVSGHSPTLLCDECDKWVYRNEDLVGLLCSGHRKGGFTMRCEGDSNELRKFGCFAPVLLAAIGALPDQLHSRSISVRLERATQQEIAACARFNSLHVEYENELCRKLARWIADHTEEIAACDPNLPEHLYNRIGDNWRPLFAIAEVAGGNWPERCTQALMKLTTREDETDSLRVMLLADIRQVFTADRMFSKDLVDALLALKERPWGEIRRGKGVTAITERWLAKNLAAFRIRPKSIRVDDHNAKGYKAADFADAYTRYLGDRVSDPSHRHNTYENGDFLSVTNDHVVTNRKPPKNLDKSQNDKSLFDSCDVGTDPQQDTPVNMPPEKRIL